MDELHSIKNQRIFYSYLNWGKGHLSRSIGLIRQLIVQGNTVIVAGEKQDREIIHSYFPTIEFIAFAGYPFQFSGKGNFTNDLWKSRRALNTFITEEQKKVETLAKQHSISLIVSDHRYGFRSKTIPSIFVTHQVQLALKWWQQPAQFTHHKMISAFTHVWIMDDRQCSLAGKLSKNTLKNATYIGHFSRFEVKNTLQEIELGVVNGPAPYNQQLLDKLVLNPTIDVIISSIPHSDSRVIRTHTWIEADEYFYRAKRIHSYAGYSTIMDIKQLNIEGNLFPTPGQTEQEYLKQLHPKIKF